MKKKIITLLTCVLAIFSLTGCVGIRSNKTSTEKKQDEDYVINDGRTEAASEYQYDWIDLIDIGVYGTNGNAFVEITPKDLKAGDFESDADFIAIKTEVSELNLNYVGQGTDNANSNSGITVDWSYNLSSGNVITISLNEEDAFSGLSVYKGDYEYRVGQLKETVDLDLFSTDNVIFYGLEETNEVSYYITENSKLKEVTGLVNNIKYKITSNDTTVVADQTVLNVEASVDSKFLDEVGYSTFELYLAKEGYRPTSLTTQLVLHNIAKVVDFSKKELTDELKEALENAIVSAENGNGDGEGNEFSAICSIQKLARDKDNYTFTVVYRDTNSEGNVAYYRRSIKIVDLNNRILLLSMDSQEKSSEEFATNPYTDGNIVFTYVDEVQSEEEVEVQEETPSEDTEVSE